MCRVFRLVLLGALLALPLSAAPSAKPSLPTFLQSLDPASAAQAKAIICPLDGSCTPSYDDCSDQYTAVNFVRQKDNGVCVYQCLYTETCYDSTGCTCGHTTTYGGRRVRSDPGQFPMGGCPAADLSFCETMVVDP